MPISKILLCALVLGAAALRGAEEWKALWNGQNLSGWSTWLRRPEPTSVVPGLAKDADGKYTAPIGSGRDPLKVFTVVQEDGRPAIRVSGEVFGELRSNKSFENYHLRFQFKWGHKKWPPRDKPATPRDTGLLYHVHSAPGAENRTWARSVELQIQERDVGDLFAVTTQISVRSRPRKVADRVMFEYDPAGEWKIFSMVPGSVGRCIKQPDNERPLGEWNTVELVCLGEDSLHIVNGKVVMRLRGPRRLDRSTPEPVTSGPLILQSEGAEVFYREISIRSITVVPRQFAEK